MSCTLCEEGWMKLFVVIKTDYCEHTLADLIVDCIFTTREEAERYVSFAVKRGYGPRKIVEHNVYDKFDWIKPEVMQKVLGS